MTITISEIDNGDITFRVYNKETKKQLEVLRLSRRIKSTQCNKKDRRAHRNYNPELKTKAYLSFIDELVTTVKKWASPYRVIYRDTIKSLQEKDLKELAKVTKIALEQENVRTPEITKMLQTLKDYGSVMEAEKIEKSYNEETMKAYIEQEYKYILQIYSIEQNRH